LYYEGTQMAKMVHAPLDEEGERMLVRLRRATGLSDSELLRRGLRAFDLMQGDRGGRRIAGLGAFASGMPDLGSNKRHLAGFGAH
jgi:hypothetical protein